MAIGLSATFLLYGALTAILVMTVFIIIGMVWLNSRIERLEKEHRMLSIRLDSLGAALERERKP